MVLLLHQIHIFVPLLILLVLEGTLLSTTASVSATSTSTTKRKILCLHGGGGNSDSGIVVKSVIFILIVVGANCSIRLTSLMIIIMIRLTLKPGRMQPLHPEPVDICAQQGKATIIEELLHIQ